MPLTSEDNEAPGHGAAAAGQPVPLRRNWRFQLLWTGSGAAYLGLDAADIAYPLVILAITGSPADAGMFGVVQTVTMVLLGLIGGAAADRINRRWLLVAAEGARALAAGSVALALVLDRLTLPHLLVVSAVLGAGASFGGPARMLMVRSVVPPSQLTQALTQEEVRGGITGLIGQPLGGVLYTLRQSLPFLLCLITFTISFACALFVRVPSPKQPDRPDGDGRAGQLAGLFSGVRDLIGNRALRAALLLITVCNLASAAINLVVIVGLREHGSSGSATGLALAGIAVGSLAGSLLIRRLHSVLGPGSLLLVSACTVVLTTLALAPAVPGGPAWVFAVLVVFSLATPALRVLVDILIFRQVPDERRGRTVAATMLLIGIGMPAGNLLGGLLLQYLPLAACAVILAAVPAAVAVLVAFDPNLRRSSWPADPAPEPLQPADDH